MSETKYHIGDIIGDLEIIDIIFNPKCTYIAKCKKCGRIRKINSGIILRNISLLHKYCDTGINKTDKVDIKFYHIWNREHKHGLKLEFFDFYDKYYQQFITLINEYGRTKHFNFSEENGFLPMIKDLLKKEALHKRGLERKNLAQEKRIKKEIKKKRREEKKKHIGDIIDDLEIIEVLPQTKKIHHERYKCKCLKCGRIRIIDSRTIKSKNCYHKFCRETNYTDTFYNIWAGIIARTKNINDPAYKWYGGKEITSSEFTLFVDFYDLMYQSYLDAIKKWPNETISIDRINVNGNYYKNNCRWIPLSLQAGNTSNSKWIKAIHNKSIFITKNIACFARILNLNKYDIYYKLNNDSKKLKSWTFEYIDINNYKNIPYLNDINAIIDITDINNPININPI